MGQGPSASAKRPFEDGSGAWNASAGHNGQPLSSHQASGSAATQNVSVTSPRASSSFLQPAEGALHHAPTSACMGPGASTAAATDSIPNGSVAPTSNAPPAAGQATTGAPVATSAQQARPNSQHKNTTLIPGWSRHLSSQHLQIECQKISGLGRPVPSGRESFGVLEMEVMKFVAYCGGVTVKFRVDEAHGTEGPVFWGLASTRACPALQQQQQQQSLRDNVGTSGQPSSGVNPANLNSVAGCDSGSQTDEVAQSKAVDINPTSKGRSRPSTTTMSGSPSCTVPVSVDNPARKPLYMVCSTSTSVSPAPGDVFTIDLAPREDRQPVIVATLRLNDVVVLQSSLPCSSVSALQMYPFITVSAGFALSLYEAVTPSPLFTWYHPGGTAPTEIAFAELDTCVKYQTQPSLPPALVNGTGVATDFVGSMTFSTGRHRWTVQLDNHSTSPTHIFVGVIASSGNHTMHGANASPLTTVQGPLRSIAGASSSAAAPALPTGSRLASVGAPGSAPSTSNSAAAAGAGGKWGAWIRLPGVNTTLSASPVVPPPPRDGLVHTAESTSGHCFITVDLDLSSGYVRFFRNGHLIGSAFQNVRGPLSPTIAFVQAPSLNCQAGLVNLTKLRQLDLQWNTNQCSGDLQIAGPVISKVSEVYGDYSTVLTTQGFVSGVHLWLVKVNSLSEPDSIFIGVCRGCMPLDQDPQDLRDRTYYLSNGVIRVGGRRVATNAANFQKGDVVGVVLDADQGEILFFRNGVEQGRARGIRGRLYPFVSCDSEGDQITLLGSYTLLLNRVPLQLADMEWDTLNHAADIELSSNCLTASKTSSNAVSTVRGTILYSGSGYHEFHVILDTLGPDGVWVGVAPSQMDPNMTVGNPGCGWALHTDGDKRFNGKEEEYAQPFKNGDLLTVCLDLGRGVLQFRRNGQALGDAFRGVTGPLVAAITLASEESKITVQNRPTVLNTGEYTGELRWDEARAGRDLHIIDGLTATKMTNDGGDYATVLGTLCMASGQHMWSVYINHVEDSNLFIGVTVGGHDLNADPQEMKHRTYYLSNGTIRVAGKLVTRCAEPYAEGDLVTVHLDMDQRHIAFHKNGVLQSAGDGLPEEVWPYVSLDNIMDSITLHNSTMFVDLAQSLRWDPVKACKLAHVVQDGRGVQIRHAHGREEVSGQATVLGLREYSKAEVNSWIVRFEQDASLASVNFLVGVAPATMDLNKSLGEEGCGIGLDFYGYFYVDGRYFHLSSLSNWAAVAKQVRGSTAKHKGKAQPIFKFVDGKCEVTITLDLKDSTLRFSHNGRSIGTIAGINAIEGLKLPLHAAVTLTSSRQTAVLAPGPLGVSEHSSEELVHVLRAKGCVISPRMEAALVLIPRDMFVPRDRQREAFRDQKVTVRMADGSIMTLPPPSFVTAAMDKLGLKPGMKFLDVGCGTGYVTALAACLVGDAQGGVVQAIECVPSRLEAARNNLRVLRERLSGPLPPACEVLGNAVKALGQVDMQLSNVLMPECTDGVTFDALYCDASVSEEDLPSFLALLKPNGSMVVVIEEEAVLITRSGQDPHDFNREVIMSVIGEFGELEGPTPWEVQESILRIKERERKRGHDQAKQEMTSLRTYEYVEMQQRVQAAMQRISELESMLQRTELNPAMRSPARGALGMSSFAGLNDASVRSPARMSGLDDVRVVVKDKSRRGQQQQQMMSSPYKPSPRSSVGRGSPLPHLSPPHLNGSVADSGEWGNMYTTGVGLDGDGQQEPIESSARARAKSLFSEQDQAASPTHSSLPGTPAPLPLLMAGTGGLATQVSMPQTTFDDLIDSMSVQTFSPEQISAMVAGSEPFMVESHEVFPGTFKGVRVRVWRVNVSHQVSYLELKRAYSKYCIAHPNISAVLGVCLQSSSGGAASGATSSDGGISDMSGLDAEDEEMAAQELDQAPNTPTKAYLLQAAGTPRRQQQQQHTLWVVEESFGQESLHERLERGLLSWQQVVKVATDVCKALAFLQDLRRAGGAAADVQDSDTDVPGSDLMAGSQVVLSSYALRTIVTPTNVNIDAQSTKVSVLPALLNHLEAVLCDPMAAPAAPATPLHCDMAYMDPNSLFSEGSAPSFYAFGVVLLQLLTEQGPLGLLSAVKESLDSGTLMNLIPRLPATEEMQAWAKEYARLALRCTQPGGVGVLEAELLPVLNDLAKRLGKLCSNAMSWEKVEEMLMLPLQPRSNVGGAVGAGDAAARRWVRQDFRMRRKLFMDEVAKLAVEAPVHKVEVRRARCFKDSVAVFAGKGHNIWRQPVKVSFIGEAGMDSGGVTREWFSQLSSSISRGSPELFWSAGPQKNQLYIHPLSNTPSHLKKFQFIGLFMAKAILESAARGKELGPITLNLPFCEPFWKLLQGVPLSLIDLQLLDPTEFRSLMSLLDIDIDNIIFETFSWSFHQENTTKAAETAANTAAGFGVGAGYVAPPSPSAGAAASASAAAFAESESTTPTAAAAAAAASALAAATAASPFSGADNEDGNVTSIPLKPGGTHLKVTNHNKREYVLLKAHKMLVGTIESQMSAIIDAFHSVIPRDLVEKYAFTCMEMQLLVCGEQRIDVQDLKGTCKYEDGFNGREDIITWFWDVVENFDDAQRRQLLQFWSGSDGMPAEGFGALDPAFHIVAVERLYDAADTTARLPAAHTCFRQLDLPRYRNQDELREKLLTAITIGQGYMALS